MNIGIDITSLLYDRGVSRYTSNLVRSLNLLNQHLFLFGYSFRQKDKLQQKANSLLKFSPSSSRIFIQNYPQSIQKILWQIGQNKVTDHFPGIDVFHSWDWLQPPDKNLPLVSTIHDLAILKYPNTAHPKILKMHQKSWQVLKERGAEIIAVSQATKKDIIELLGFPSYKVHVVAEALPLEIKKNAEALTEERSQVIKDKLQLNKPYLLFVGTREPRKNLSNLILAWQKLSNSYQLIIAGAEGWDSTEQRFSHPNLRFLGKVSDEELAVLYGEAELFVYPSLYEGFGLPILEAFYHGTPVVAANVNSLIEVAGNAAEFVEPESITSIYDGMVKVLNETKQEQQKRLQRMIIRLQMFSWEKVARETLAIYQLAVDNHS